MHLSVPVECFCPVPDHDKVRGHSHERYCVTHYERDGACTDVAEHHHVRDGKAGGLEPEQHIQGPPDAPSPILGLTLTVEHYLQDAEGADDDLNKRVGEGGSAVRAEVCGALDTGEAPE